MFRSLAQFSVATLLVASVASMPADASERTSGSPSAPSGEATPESSTTEEESDSSEHPDETAESPCQVPAEPGSAWLDKVRDEVFESVCGTARWFDGFFGDRRFDAEARTTHGRLRLLTLYDEFEGFDAKIRLRAEVSFPNLDQRVNAFLGREAEDEFLRGEDTRFGQFLPDFFREADEQDWLLGLGYRPVGTARHKFDLDGGVKLKSPLEPFVRGRYRRYWVFGDRHLVRFRETVYWRNQRGVGTSASVDVERVIGENKLLRWEGRGTVDEATEGMEWVSAVVLYQGFGQDRALAYRFAWDGETDHAVPVRRFGPQVTYRQRMFREWFFGEIVTGVTWPKDEIGQTREAAFNIGVGAEISFGNEPD